MLSLAFTKLRQRKYLKKTQDNIEALCEKANENFLCEFDKQLTLYQKNIDAKIDLNKLKMPVWSVGYSSFIAIDIMADWSIKELYENLVRDMIRQTAQDILWQISNDKITEPPFIEEYQYPHDKLKHVGMSFRTSCEGGTSWLYLKTCFYPEDVKLLP
jgi:hypothetical protein